MIITYVRSFAHISIPYREKNPKAKTDLIFVAVYVLCNYYQDPKPFSDRGNFIAVAGGATLPKKTVQPSGDHK